jgi:hypothetical protein
MSVKIFILLFAHLSGLTAGVWRDQSGWFGQQSGGSVTHLKFIGAGELGIPPAGARRKTLRKRERSATGDGM